MDGPQQCSSVRADEEDDAEEIDDDRSQVKCAALNAVVAVVYLFLLLFLSLFC